VRLDVLDGDPGRRSLAHLWVGSKAPWYAVADGLPAFAREPDAHAEESEARLGKR
jgi:hypothetical protein